MSTLPLPDDTISPEASASVPAESDQKYGRYRLCFELAAGGMGKVFLARAEGPEGFEKLVALKRIHPHLAEERTFVEMFLDEARIASRISHPNVCSVFDFGEQDGTYYIAMDYLVGEPLSRILAGCSRVEGRGGRERMLIGCRIVADACEGLHAAHELRGTRGDPLHVVHRDISPHNLFVTFDGGVKVVDFGIARAADQIHDTTTGSVKGKWAYMSPEQAHGETVDRTTDVWSMGVVLWEVATGKRLFHRKTATKTVLAVTMEPIPKPSDADPRVPPALDAIVMRALDRDPKKRHRSARELGREILRFLNAEGVTIGLPDIAEWLEDLFPAALSQKQQLLELANQAAVPVPQVSEARMGDIEDDPGQSGVHPPRRKRRRSQLETAVSPLSPTVGAGGSPRPSRGAKAAEPAPDDARASTIPTEGLRQSQMPTRPRAAPAPAPTPRPRRALVVGAAAVGLAVIAGSFVAFRGAFVNPPAPAQAHETAAGEAATAEEANGSEVDEGDEPPSTEEAGSPETPGSHAGDPPVADESPSSTSDETRTPSARRRRRPRMTMTAAGAMESATAVAQSQPSGEGTVNVVTTGGWALVFLNGRRLGETPGRFTLPAGEHLLEVRPNGTPPGRRVRVVVEPGGRQRITVPLD